MGMSSPGQDIPIFLIEKKFRYHCEEIVQFCWYVENDVEMKILNVLFFCGPFDRWIQIAFIR